MTNTNVNVQKDIEFLKQAGSDFYSNATTLRNSKAQNAVDELDEIMERNGLSLSEYLMHLEYVVDVESEKERLERIIDRYEDSNDDKSRQAVKETNEILVGLRKFDDQVKLVLVGVYGKYELLTLSDFYNAAVTTLEHIREAHQAA